MTEIMEGQMSLLDQDTWCGKMFPEPCPQTKAKTSGVSLKKPQRSFRKMPLFLDLTKDGHIAEASWEKATVSLGGYTMHSIGEYRNEEECFVFSQTSTDIPQQKYCLLLNIGEYPREKNETKLSDVLEEETDEKYNLSSRACKGILNRAEKRGKKLPDILREALEGQIDD